MKFSARFLTHCGFLLGALLLTYFWTKNPELSVYTLQGVAFFVILYFLNHFFERYNRYFLATDGLAFTMVTLLLVTQTGGLTSPLFFLLYILLFGLSLFFEPLPTLVFSVALMAYFFGQIQDLSSAVQIMSLSLMTPLALYFGRQYLQLMHKEEKIRILQKRSEALSAEVTAQEEDTLMWLALSFREQTHKILHLSSNLLADLAHLTPMQRESLQSIHESAKSLLRTGQKLKEKIEE